MDHQSAEQYCQDTFGTHLATIQPYDLPEVLSSIPAELDFKDAWIGLILSDTAQTGNVWLDGTEYDIENNLVKLSGVSDCRSFDGDRNEIVDTISCNVKLPFMCNKRVKPRGYTVEDAGTVNGVTFNEGQSFCESVYGTDLVILCG